MTVELDYLCDVCGLLIDDGMGSLYVRDVDLRVRRADDQEWRRVHGDGPVTIAELFSHPQGALWLIHHDRCRPDESDGYHIAVDQVRTYQSLLAWTARLMDKRWLPDTNWGSVIAAAAEGRDRRIAPATQHGDAA